MTGLDLEGALGVSIHAGRLVRLWEARTGRRLGTHLARHELSACATGAGGVVAVGDACGGVYVFSVDAHFAPHALHRTNAPVRSLALVPLGDRADPSIAVVSTSARAVSLCVVRSSLWPPADAERVALAMPELIAADGDLIR